MQWDSQYDNKALFLYGLKTSVCIVPHEYGLFRIQAELTVYRQPNRYYNTNPDGEKNIYYASNGWRIKSNVFPHVSFTGGVCSKVIYIRGRDTDTNDTTIVREEETPNPKWLTQLQDTLAEFEAWANRGVVADFKPQPDNNRYTSLELD